VCEYILHIMGAVLWWQIHFGALEWI